MSDNKALSVQAEINEKRLKALADAERRQRETEAAIPSLADINRQIRGIGPRLLALGIEGAADYEERSMKLYREHEQLMAKKAELLRSKGYSEDYDLPVFECKECNDTGFVGITVCSCMKKARAKRAYFASGLGKALSGQTFDSLDMRYYAGTTSGGLSVKSIMQNNMEYCKIAGMVPIRNDVEDDPMFGVDGPYGGFLVQLDYENLAFGTGYGAFDYTDMHQDMMHTEIQKYLLGQQSAKDALFNVCEELQARMKQYLADNPDVTVEVPLYPNVDAE